MSARPFALLAVLVLAACGQAEPPTPAQPLVTQRGGGAFGPFQADAPAIAYNAELVPVGAKANVVLTSSDTGVTTELAVIGLLPGRVYGAHAHVKPCGEKPDAAGPHFQDKADPVTPSVDPAYANDRNEIWLDFTTDPAGAATVKSTVDWKLGDRRPASVVIHEKATHTDAGHAGTAGARLGCLTLR